MPANEETMELPTTVPEGEIDVFDLDGKQHRMTRLNAHDCVQHLKWSFKVAVRNTPTPAKVVVLVAKTAANVKPEDSEQIDLGTLSDIDLKAFALKHFDMSFNESVGRADVMAALLQEQTA
jgi:hypothetical protein